jgi:hypothetical protein
VERVNQNIDEVFIVDKDGVLDFEGQETLVTAGSLILLTYRLGSDVPPAVLVFGKDEPLTKAIAASKEFYKARDAKSIASN